MRIPVSRPDLSGNEKRYVCEALDSTWISSTGPFIDRFEREWAAACGVAHAVTVTSGTTALHLALLGLDVRPGDEVLVPALTYVAVANACRYVGAEPVFVDVDPGTWCIDPGLLEGAVTRRTRGIIAAHNYGHPADMDAINQVAAVHGLWVVEDAAEAHFATYNERPVGGLGRVGVFSLYGNKVLGIGEGGAVVTSDAQLNLRLRTLRGQGVDPARRYFFPVTGYNFRMTNVAAALACAQLERADELLTQRRRVYARYTNRLASCPRLTLQPQAPWATVTPWMYCVLFDEPRARHEAEHALAKRDIETRPFFVPLHTLPPFREESRRRGDHLPHTESLSRRGLSLPTYPGLTDAEVDEVCDGVLDVLQ